MHTFHPASDHDLQSLNTLAVPARAAQFVCAENEETVKEALRFAHARQLPLLVLGGGSNVVLPAYFPGLVVQPGIMGIETIAEDADHVWLRVGAGEVWQGLVEYSLQQGWFGLENLSLIPGTVGAAPIQNIGAYGVELDSVFDSLEAISRQNLEQISFTATDCEFRYRDSVFKRRLKDTVVITRVVFKLRKQGTLNVAYAPLQDAVSNIPPEKLTPRKVGDAVIAIRRSKLPDPAEIPNAGSFFKNPIVSREHLERLRRDHPDIVSFPYDAERVKLAAGWLLEKAGWRGNAQNGVGMHERQALVLVNPGHCSGERLLEYARTIQADIAQRFDVALEREPVAYLKEAASAT